MRFGTVPNNTTHISVIKTTQFCTSFSIVCQANYCNWRQIHKQNQSNPNQSASRIVCFITKFQVSLTRILRFVLKGIECFVIFCSNSVINFKNVPFELQENWMSIPKNLNFKRLTLYLYVAYLNITLILFYVDIRKMLQ